MSKIKIEKIEDYYLIYNLLEHEVVVQRRRKINLEDIDLSSKEETIIKLCEYILGGKKCNKK
jgi:hypothetical protein